MVDGYMSRSQYIDTLSRMRSFDNGRSASTQSLNFSPTASLSQFTLQLSHRNEGNARQDKSATGLDPTTSPIVAGFVACITA